MFHCVRLGLVVSCTALVATAAGCSRTVPVNVTESSLNWDGLSSMVIAVDQYAYTGWESTVCYSLEGNAALEVVDALRENVVTSGCPTQTVGGTQLRIFALDQDGGQRDRFIVDFQYVEGMGDKLNWHPGDLQDGQIKRCSLVISLIQETGRPLSNVEFEQYVQESQNSGYTKLYWKN